MTLPSTRDALYDADDDDDLHPMQVRQLAHVKRRDSRRTKKPTLKPVPADTETVTGTVVEVYRDSALVATRDGDLDVAVDGPTMRRILGSYLAVGDLVSVVDRSPSPSRIARVTPRRSVLRRGHPHNPHQPRVVVANIDYVAVVSAATDPPFRPRLVDRYLVAILGGGAQPIVVVSKADLADDARRAELQDLLAPYPEIGFPTLCCSALTGEGLASLRAIIAGRRVAFVGHSGTGKSSLVNALGSQAVIGDLAEHGRGRHTTSSAAIHQLDDGTEIVDTPGVRQFAPWRMTLGDLRAAFPDLAGVCHYTGCTHEHEPDCAVKEGVETGVILESRLDSWLRLLPAVV